MQKYDEVSNWKYDIFKITTGKITFLIASLCFQIYKAKL